MMRALGSDLLELISTVAEETTHISDIVQIYREELFAEKLDDDSYDYESDDEDCDTSDDEDDDDDETRSRGSIDRISSSDLSICNNTDVTFHATAKQKQTPVDRELEKRRNNPQTYLKPLPCVEEAIYTVPLHMANQDDCHDGDLELTVLVGGICNNRDCDDDGDNDGGVDQRREMEEYLRSFDIYESTEEIARELRANSDLEDIFHRIVPLEVSYTDFWMRFFYRCDRTRIGRELMMVHGIAGSVLTPAAGHERQVASASRRVIQDHGTDNNKAATAPAPPSSPKSVLKAVQWDDVPSYHPPN